MSKVSWLLMLLFYFQFFVSLCLQHFCNMTFFIPGQPYCSLPNTCPLTTRELPGETLRLFTCVECPRHYPWILDPTGDGAAF